MPPRATFRFRSRDHNEMLRKFLRSCQPLPLGLLLIFIAWSAMKGVLEAWLAYLLLYIIPD